MSYQYPMGGQMPGGQLPHGGHAAGGKRRGRTIAGSVLAVAGVALLAGGAVLAAGSRSAAASAQRSASSQPTLSVAALADLATSPSAWTQIPVVQLFPTTIVSANSDITWVRLGVAAPASCSAALTSSWSSDPMDACRVVLRSTYMVRTRDILATIAIIVTPVSAEDASADWTGLSSADNDEDYPTSLQPVVQYPVNVAPVPGTLAAHWRDADVQAFNGASNGSFDFVSVVETGTIDGRDVGNLPAQWARQRGAAYDQASWVGPGDDLSSAYTNYLFTISGGAAG